MIESERLQTKPRADKSAAANWGTRVEGQKSTTQGGYKGASVGGPITGLGGDLLLVDDPHKNWVEISSPTYRKRVIDWFNSTFYTRAEPNASIIVIQTRWHEDDLTGYLLNEHTDDWIHVNLPAIAEADDPIGRAPGEALCPERYGVEDLLKIKESIGEQMFAGLYQQRPAPAEGGMIKREWLKHWTELPSEFDEMIQAWDMSFKKTKTGSFVVGQIWGRKEAKYYLIHQIRERMDFAGTIHSVRLMSESWKRTTTKLVENAANGPAVISTLKDEIPGIVPVSVSGESKESRLASVSPLFEAGNVYLPHPSLHGWVNELIEELVGFPNMRHDDQVDACTLALNRFKNAAFVNFELDLKTGTQANPWRL